MIAQLHFFMYVVMYEILTLRTLRDPPLGRDLRVLTVEIAERCVSRVGAGMQPV